MCIRDSYLDGRAWDYIMMGLLHTEWQPALETGVAAKHATDADQQEAE
jgi:hypothetical protein